MARLGPVLNGSGTVGGILALRDDTFEAELAGMGEDGRAVALDMLVEPDAGAGLATIDANVALRTSSGSRRRSSPFSSIRSKAYRNVLSSSRR
jgi:hypothetical protein